MVIGRNETTQLYPHLSENHAETLTPHRLLCRPIRDINNVTPIIN